MWAAKKLGLVSSRKRTTLSTFRWSMLDQNKLTAATAQNEIIDTTRRLISIGFILPETIAHPIKPKVAAKNRRVKSTGKPRNSGKFLYRPANRKSTKLASIEIRSAQLRESRGDCWFSSRRRGWARSDASMRFSVVPLLGAAESCANIEEVHRAQAGRGRTKPDR